MGFGQNLVTWIIKWRSQGFVISIRAGRFTKPLPAHWQ